MQTTQNIVTQRKNLQNVQIFLNKIIHSKKHGKYSKKYLYTKLSTLSTEIHMWISGKNKSKKQNERFVNCNDFLFFLEKNLKMENSAVSLLH